MLSKEEFGKRIKMLRTEKGVSIADAANKMEISGAVLSDYERGAKSPGYDAIQRIAEYYEVSFEYLFGKSDAKNAENNDIVKRLGLSEKTILELEQIKRRSDNNGAGEKELSEVTILNCFLDKCCQKHIFFYLRKLLLIIEKEIQTPSEVIDNILEKKAFDELLSEKEKMVLELKENAVKHGYVLIDGTEAIKYREQEIKNLLLHIVETMLYGEFREKEIKLIRSYLK